MIETGQWTVNILSERKIPTIGLQRFRCPFLMEVKATPFWNGLAEESILHDIISRLPKNLETTLSLLFGGGALFWNFRSRIQKANLSDFNVELVHTYEVVKTRPHKLIDLLEEHAKALGEIFLRSTRKILKNKVELLQHVWFTSMIELAIMGFFRWIVKEI